MADVVYILGGGAKAIDDRPLRWSLRSLAKYAANVDRVIVVGQIPKWLSAKALVVPTRVTTLPGGDAVKSWNIMYGYAMAVLRLGALLEDLERYVDNHAYVTRGVPGIRGRAPGIKGLFAK